MPRVCLILLFSLIGLAPPASSQVAPARGEALRSAILDGLRAGITDVPGLKRDVIFRVHKLAVLDAFALATVTPIAPGGDRIYEYETSRECDSEILALLQFTEVEWEVVERDVGPCDYIWRAVFEQTPEYPAALLSYWEEMPAAY